MIVKLTFVIIQRGEQKHKTQIHHAETTNIPNDFITADVIKSWWDYSGKTVGIQKTTVGRSTAPETRE